MLTVTEITKIRKSVSKTDPAMMRMFSALSDRCRFTIFQALLLHEGICVTEVAGILDVSVPAASQQLKIMEQSGLILRQRDGQKICYKINTEHAVVPALIKLLNT